MEKKQLYILGIVLVTFSACSIKFDCMDKPIDFSFIGFDSAAASHIVIRKYPMNNGFNQVLDTLEIRGTGAYAYFQYGPDTIRVRQTSGKEILVANYEWEIVLPAAGRTVRLEAINSEHETHTRGWGLYALDPVETACYNRVFSFKVDGQILTPLYPEMPEFYIRK